MIEDSVISFEVTSNMELFSWIALASPLFSYAEVERNKCFVIDINVFTSSSTIFICKFSLSYCNICSTDLPIVLLTVLKHCLVAYIDVRQWLIW
jgi:hypothetical protein